MNKSIRADSTDNAKNIFIIVFLIMKIKILVKFTVQSNPRESQFHSDIITNLSAGRERKEKLGIWFDRLI